MNEYARLTAQFAAGMLLGAFFFGGLWLTVKSALSSARPGLIFAVSLLLRTVVTLIGFYYVSGQCWQGVLVCMAGFMLARLVSVRPRSGCLWCRKGSEDAPEFR